MPSASLEKLDTTSKSWLLVLNTEGVTGLLCMSFLCSTAAKLGPGCQPRPFAHCHRPAYFHGSTHTLQALSARVKPYTAGWLAVFGRTAACTVTLTVTCLCLFSVGLLCNFINYIKLSIYICVLQLHCRLLVLLVDKSEFARATLRQSRTVTGCVLLGIMEGAIGDGAVDGYNAQFTWTAFFCCLTAASGGALFGYDNGTPFAPNQLARKARCR